MTKQEEIREGINDIIRASRQYPMSDSMMWDDDVTDEIVKYLHSQGVVIKVGEEEIEAVDTFGATYKTKCVAVEPLIED